ncbi:MAG: methyltransferase domain-containing protein [Lutibacter sp.]|nr:methyltransferase domain-containing protein [Lutibacter sp.]
MIFGYNRSRRDIWIQSHLKMIDNDAVLLDVGAGSSPYKEYLSHCKYFAHDFVQLDNTQIQDEEGYSKMDFISDVLNIPVENSFADAILCTEVIEHVKHPTLVIKELNRIVKKGGKLFLTAPLISGIHQAPYHFYGGFTKYWYLEILAENGFEIIELKENGIYSYHS